MTAIRLRPVAPSDLDTLFARVTVDHAASRRVLEKVGFHVTATESFEGSSGDEVEEYLLKLD